MTGSTSSATRSPMPGHISDADNTLTGSSVACSPLQFAALCQKIATEPDKETRHRLFDQASNELLCSLGFSEGVEIFRASVASYHTKGAPHDQ